MTTPNITNERLVEYNGGPITVTAITFIVLNTIFVALRFLSRHYQRAPFGVDDILIFLAWLLIMGLCATLLSE